MVEPDLFDRLDGRLDGAQTNFSFDVGANLTRRAGLATSVYRVERKRQFEAVRSVVDPKRSLANLRRTIAGYHAPTLAVGVEFDEVGH